MSERARHLAIDVLAFLFLAAIYLRLAIYNGPEASWDLRNYHLYTPFALLHGKASYDLYPASQHTFANPALDLPSYVARVALLDRPNILSCLLSLPTIISAFMAYRICLYMLPASARVRQPLALIATLLGATGIGTMGTLASTDSEAFPGMFTLAGLLCVVGAARECRGAWMHYTAGGALCGLAVGLKLTQMYCAVALVASVLLLSAATWRNRLPAAAAVALGCGAGAAITGGPWWLSLYLKFGNPIFPFFNNVFRSPFYPPVQISTEYLKPNGALETLFYPFYWAFEVQRRVWEGPNREPRFAVAYVAVVLAVLVALAARRWARAPGTEDSERSGKLVLGFFAIAFVVWEAQFSIYRYLFPLEMIAGAPLLIALRPWLAGRRFGLAPHASLAALAGLCWLWTVYPTTGRAKPASPAAQATLPGLHPGDMVVLLDGSPMSFLAAFADARVRFVGTNNELINPDRPSPLRDQVEVAIRTQEDTIWGVESPAEQPGAADTALAFYKLQRAGPCKPVDSNLSPGSIQLCRLAHRR